MFTGIVKAIGRVAEVRGSATGRRMRIESPNLESFRLNPGDSVSVAGVCLTIIQADPGGFSADVSAETQACTTLGGMDEGGEVNLEPALAAGEPFGGHLVTGHVDGRAKLKHRSSSGDSIRMRFVSPDGLERLIAAKGSVALDGVSLTVNRVDGAEFEVNVIPHTLKVTTLGGLEKGDEVNLEVDLVARYLERLASVSKC